MTGREVAKIEPPETALASRDAVAGLLRPVAAPSEVLAAQNETRQLVHQALKEGRDHGKIPGTDKPTLLKPGAERINAAFGCAPRYRILESEIDHFRTVEWTKRKKEWYGPQGSRKFKWVAESGTSQGLYRYVVECELVHRASGAVIGQGMASASTMESKYIDRPRDSENTVLKMAEKRAFIAATLNAFGLSDEFTQDIEDLEPAENGVTTPTPASQQSAKKDRATSGQVDEIRILLSAETITDDERDQMNGRLTKGITAAKADEAIGRLKEMINTRLAQGDGEQTSPEPEQPRQATGNKALAEAAKLYRAAIDEYAPHLALDDDERDSFEEKIAGRTSKEDYTVTNYRACIAALEAGQARLPEEAGDAA